jgi:hypothetical protein
LRLVHCRTVNGVFAFRAIRSPLCGRTAKLLRSLASKWRATADEDGHYCFAVAL